MKKMMSKVQTLGMIVLLFGSGIALVMMTVYGTLDALSPRLLGITMPGAYEWIGYVLVFVIWLPLPFVQLKRDAGISISIIRDRAPVRIQRWLDVMRNIAMMVLFVPLFWQSGLNAWYDLVMGGRFPAVPPIPSCFAKFAITIGVGLALVVCLFNLASQLARLGHRQRDQDIKALKFDSA